VSKVAQVKAPSVSKKTAGKPRLQAISAGERHRLIAEAAYLRGEALGFLSDEREDWLYAEVEVDARLAKAGVKVRG
jgi:hypothetical protein